MSNRIGRREEMIFGTIVSRKSMHGKFLFDPNFLGDKFPAVDFYVALADFPMHAFFFVSVKTTTLGYTAGGQKLKIAINKEELAELAKFNLPVYIFGIDEKKEQAYIIAASELDSSMNISGIDTKFPASPANMELLCHEVGEYWKGLHKKTKFLSFFK